MSKASPEMTATYSVIHLGWEHDTMRSGAKAILLRDESLVSAGVVPNVIHLEGWVELVKAIDFDGRYEVTIRRVPTL